MCHIIEIFWTDCGCIGSYLNPCKEQLASGTDPEPCDQAPTESFSQHNICEECLHDVEIAETYVATKSAEDLEVDSMDEDSDESVEEELVEEDLVALLLKAHAEAGLDK
ncbi:MAG: hypothetical protein MMC23_002591 [Stictis urceolatum]|nr:hypothetical protein [Stictis urceolata]